MTDLLNVLPDFDVAVFSHILPSLEKACICTADLITLDAPDVARRAQVPPGEVKKLSVALLAGLHNTTVVEKLSSSKHDEPNHKADDASRPVVVRECSAISTLDDRMDSAFGGGMYQGQLTEIVGESAAGKTQLLLTLLLSVQLLGGSDRGKSALYISTEAPLQTSRLLQILKTHPKLVSLPEEERPSLSRIQSMPTRDLETQEHVIRYQVPVAIQKLNAGLLVVDSIAANYRAEYERGATGRNSAASLAKRNMQLAQMGALLRSLAQKYNIAVVVANQVADRFSVIESAFQTSTPLTQGLRSDPPAYANGHMSPQLPRQVNLLSSQSAVSLQDPLALEHQQRFFTGWGNDIAVTNLKTPSLGLTWTNQLATRIALLKKPIYDEAAVAPGEERNLIGWKRSCHVVFSAWCQESETKYEIWEGGIRSLVENPEDA